MQKFLMLGHFRAEQTTELLFTMVRKGIQRSLPLLVYRHNTGIIFLDSSFKSVYCQLSRLSCRAQRHTAAHQGKRKSFAYLLELNYQAFMHTQVPYCHPVVEVLYTKAYNRVVIVEPFIKHGSLKDMIYKVMQLLCKC